MQDLGKFLSLLECGDGFLLTTHLHPDGDGLGSMLALGRGLLGRGKHVAMVLSEGLPSAYAFLEGASSIVKYAPARFQPQYLIALDCGDRDRMALAELPAAIPVLNLDHHLSNNRYGLLNLVDPEAAATGEIVYRVLTAAGIPLDRGIATALYVAIATDTGFFRYTNASAGALSLAASLAREFRLEPGRIAEVVHEQKTMDAVRLLGMVLGTLQLTADGKVAWMCLTREMLALFPVEQEETEGFVNYARSIIGVEIALFFKENKEGEIRVSWRSGAQADVSRLAAHFGGGGHARAAGCTIQGRMEDAIQQILTYLGSWRKGRVALK